MQTDSLSGHVQLEATCGKTHEMTTCCHGVETTSEGNIFVAVKQNIKSHIIAIMQLFPLPLPVPTHWEPNAMPSNLQFFLNAAAFAV